MQKLGKFEIYAISDGFFSLDGGAMFGIVPKVIWQKIVTPDSLNRINLSLNCLLVKTGKTNILIEAGLGNKYNQKWIDMYNMKQVGSVPISLRKSGLDVKDIDIVILSHLHFDHAGGCTIQDRDGKLMPTFPNAEYIVQEKEWYDATHPDERTRGSYIDNDFIPLNEAKKIKFINGDTDIENGITIKVSGGHTKTHQIVIIDGGENKKAAFFGCVMPTTWHTKPAYVMAFDLFPQEVVKARRELLLQASAERWLCTWIHDPKIVMGYINKVADKGYTVEPVEFVK